MIFLVSQSPTVWSLPNEFAQSGYLTDGDDRPLDGLFNIRVLLHDRAGQRNAQLLFEELHQNVVVEDGWYFVHVGSQDELPNALFQRDELYFSISVDGGQEVTPRLSLGRVPAAFIANVALNVVGNIEPRSVRINGQVVIDENGRWVGAPAGLAGPAGPEGPAGPAGPRGPQGEPGAGGSDTPAQVLAKLLMVDGRDSRLDSDLFDGFTSDDFVRTAGQVLTRLRTVDGSGSGVDADRLDGLDSSEFIRTAAEVLASLRTVDGANSGVDADRFDGLDSSEFPRTGAQILERLREVDGEDSRLDADRLDGLNSGQFMRTDRDTGTLGNLNVTGVVTAQHLRMGAGSTIGVDVDQPNAEVDVNGRVRANSLILAPQAAPPEQPTAGQVYFDEEMATLRFFNGQEWVIQAPPHLILMQNVSMIMSHSFEAMVRSPIGDSTMKPAQHSTVRGLATTGATRAT